MATAIATAADKLYGLPACASMEFCYDPDSNSNVLLVQIQDGGRFQVALDVRTREEPKFKTLSLGGEVRLTHMAGRGVFDSLHPNYRKYYAMELLRLYVNAKALAAMIPGLLSIDSRG